jgi:hypothetical protein
MLTAAENDVLSSAIRVNTIIMAAAFAILGGGLLWFSTVILLLRGGHYVGMHLSLLSVFFPGYSVTWGGAWIGLAWGLIAGALSGVVLYWSYARSLRESLGSQVLEASERTELTPPTFVFSGNALGVGLGALMALRLIITTNWLVIRGTAPYSKNAALLSQYLPGYSVSFTGSLVGACELFAVVFVLSHVLAGIYNAVARTRAGAPIEGRRA